MKHPVEPRTSGLWAGQAIDGVQLHSLRVHADSRGSFTEIFCAEWGLCINPTQWSIVTSQPRVLRGLHLHLRHDEYICVIQGWASIGLYDLRPDSPTTGASCLIDLCGEDMACVAFPSGIAHGWYFHEPTIHAQAVSESYMNYKDDDNLGVHWSDPALNLPWPDPDPIVADRANGFGSLAALKARLRTNGFAH